jgi:hypothetical protein
VSPEVRIGDREREQATALLNEHYTAGRLDTAEHGERLDAIWSARTRADLDQVFWDLPRLAPVPPPSAAPAVRRPRRGLPVLPLLLLAIVLVAVTGVPWWLLAIGAWVLIAKWPAWSGHRDHRGHRGGGCGWTRR